MGLSCTADSSTVRWRSQPHGFDSEGLAAGAMRSMRSCPALPGHHALALGTAPCSFYGVVIGQGGHILRAIRTATNTAIEIQTRDVGNPRPRHSEQCSRAERAIRIAAAHGSLTAESTDLAQFRISPLGVAGQPRWLRPPVDVLGHRVLPLQRR